MSGPAPSEKLYSEFNDMNWTQNDVYRLQTLADRVDGGLLKGDDSDLPTDEIAALLRAKADRIDAALQTIQNQTHDDYNDLVKAIQYRMSGDYGEKQVREAWESYGEK